MTYASSLRSVRSFAVLAAAGLMLVPAVASAADPPRLTTPANATRGDLNPGRLYSAPFLAADPSNPKVIVGAYAELRSRHCGLAVTTDGGVTWSQAQGSPSPDDYPFCVWNNFANQAAMGRDGRAYVAISGWDDRDGGPRTGNMTLVVSRTDDLGVNWRPTIVATVRGKEGTEVEQHRPSSLAVDSKRGDDIVYAAFNRTQPGKTAPNAEPSRPMIAVSTNGGRTFGAPVDLSAGLWTDAVRQQAFSSATTTTVAPNASTTTTLAPAAGSRAAQPNQEANFGGSNPRIALDDGGTVYVAWRSATANVPNSQPAAPSTFVSVSKDQGKTWTTNQVMNYTVGSPSRLAWTKEGGPDGSLVIIFGRNLTTEVSGGGDIMIQRSTDGGKTWGEPQNITDDDPKALVGQFVATLSAAPNGRLDAAWYDTRDDPGIRSNDVYYSYSLDGGATWSPNVRVSDLPINRTYGVWANNFDVTPPIGLASTNELAVFGWDDTRNTDPASVGRTEVGGGVQDIYAATAQHETIGTGTSKAAKVVLAAVAGLVLVAVILLVAATVMRRRSPASPVETRTTAKTKV